MKKFICVWALILLFSVGLFSHEYIVDNNPTRAWSVASYVGTTQVTTLTGGSWDFGYYDLALPANNQFYFYGQKVTHLRITTKGYIVPGFGSPPSGSSVYSSNDPIPDTSSPHPVIAVLWDDWYLVSAGEIWYNFSGPITTVEWRGVPHWGSPGYYYSFTAVITGHTQFQLPDNIFFRYDAVEQGHASFDYGASATIGVEHPGGTQGDEYSYNTASVNNGDQVLFSPFIPIYDNTDGWGDGYPDPIVFRPGDGMWYIKQNPNTGSSTASIKFGTKNDIAVPGDYDGNGYIDWGVYRPSTGQWFTDGLVADFSVTWGQPGDIPVPADWDGDGDTDLGVFRPQSGLWFIYYLPGGTSTSIQYGTYGDVPVPGDYDNDGITDIAVYRPSNTVWYIRKSSNPAQSYEFPWGTDGDIPMPANFQTPSYSTACVYRPSTGQWFSYNQTSGTSSIIGPWGTASDVPVPNDWNAGGISDAIVFRPEVGMWYIELSSDFQWGQLGDKPRCRRSTQIVAPPPGTNSSTTDATGAIKKE
jgi:hypothetical protein